MRTRWVVYFFALSSVASACKSPDVTPPQPEPTSDPRGAPAASSPRPTPPGASSAKPTPGRPPTPGAARTVRVYVAGESIERRNHWVAPPFTATGALNERGGGDARNDDDEYGWAVPFADRLALRDSGLKVQWVGSDTWLDGDDNPYSGTYPTGGPGRTSAISGTSIESWVEQRKAELTSKKHCYDVAIAARGGNDFGLDDDAAVKSALTQLVLLLAAGSSCQKKPLVYITAHLPDDQRGAGEGPADAQYTRQQKHRFVERFKAVADEVRAAHPEIQVRFADMFTPFLENRPSQAFPKEVWARGEVIDRAKIGRKGDKMHPRRLASIFAGEILADAFDIPALRALPP